LLNGGKEIIEGYTAIYLACRSTYTLKCPEITAELKSKVELQVDTEETKNIIVSSEYRIK
jgi:hypothetical protein